ncbi:putative aldouronate transport system substrate-binding protein [Thermocatellispora tengchongensis]|uniref:Putative aldouronate transport system substrate-binding protein n=1 Tax=Thermocatellispora tengchongensis TaxID=1073253 RepID=A0A840P448_9ACTN|nr:extracellular solute-binding protein [Thermocatellispora tengchongensis]MBB5133769.1 putative aldouronate transport system substrate-binding protein [Thermocatellispora tengchongensis]
MSAIDRRTLLRFAGIASLAAWGVPSLTGCASGGTGSVSNTGRDRTPWPVHRRLEGPAPDLKAGVDGALDAFFRYPATLSRSADQPGDGSDVTAFIPTYGPPPAPVESNRLWQAINQALGVNIKLNLVPISEYKSKLTTLMASNDLPDIIMIMPVPRVREFIAASCADISDYVGGNRVADYPNLANLPTVSWQSMGRIGGKIYGVPLSRARAGNALHINRTAYDAAGAPLQWTAEQFFESLKAVTGGRMYGFGAVSEDLGMPYHAASHKAPQQWRLEGGAFVHMSATEEYRAAIEFAAKCFQAGYYHPSSKTGTLADIMNLYYSQNVGAVMGNFMNYANGIYIDRVGDRFTTDLALSYGDGHWLGTGLFGYTVFKKASPERVKMLLRICDFLAAPFGTKEHELVNHGVEGVHFTRGDGLLQPTEPAAAENRNSLPIGRYICCAPEYIFIPGKEQQVRHAFDIQNTLLSKGIANPADGLASPTMDADGERLTRELADAVNAIITGRAGMSTWDAAARRWRDGGGAKIADELAAEHAAGR